MAHRYLIALGSNQRHPRLGDPRRVLDAALVALDVQGITRVAASPIVPSAPVGPSQRRYANAAALVESRLDPPQMLARLQAVEALFGRKRQGQPWRARVLDLDIVLWSGGAYSVPGLTVPHVHFRDRTFVLGPARHVAPHWRDPITGLSLRHLYCRLTRPRPLP
ncbi:MAG: 2-amino-4-hydroxy-6-hydroxymethyldihydropteridine diphosphokinase [Novosphingobium sp.]